MEKAISSRIPRFRMGQSRPDTWQIECSFEMCQDEGCHSDFWEKIPSFYYLGLFWLLVSNFLSPLQNLDIRPLSDVGLVKVLFQSVGCHFVLLIVSFDFFLKEYMNSKEHIKQLKE